MGVLVVRLLANGLQLTEKLWKTPIAYVVVYKGSCLWCQEVSMESTSKSSQMAML